VVKVVAWIKFEDEDVVDTGRPPTIRVDSKQEHEQDDEKQAAIHAQSRVPVHATHTEIHYTHAQCIHNLVQKKTGNKMNIYGDGEEITR